MCGSNAGAELKLANGVDVGTDTGGTGNQDLRINGDGVYSDQASDFEVAEIITWNVGLTVAETWAAHDYLRYRVLGQRSTVAAFHVDTGGSFTNPAGLSIHGDYIASGSPRSSSRCCTRTERSCGRG